MICLLIAFIMSPLLVVLIISFERSNYAIWPPNGFTIDRYLSIFDLLQSTAIINAFFISIKLAFLASTIATLIGGSASYAIVRYDIKHSDTIESILLSPLIIPWLLLGFMVLLLIGRLSSNNIAHIELSFWTVLVGHVLFLFPYATRAIGSSLYNFDHALEEASRDLGANEVRTFLKVTLPLIKPGIISSLVLTFILSFNQYIISLFLASGGEQTVPLEMFNLVRTIPATSVAAIASIQMVGILTIVLLTEMVVGISDFI